MLESRQFVPRPIEDVFEFFSDASNLEELTPDFLGFRILTPQPIEMREGTLIEYQLKLYGIPQRWTTRIEEWDPPTRFVDVQLSGPYRLWRHTHSFNPVQGGTVIDDRVEYDLPFGPIGWATHAILVRQTLMEIFQYRQRQVRHILGSES